MDTSPETDVSRLFGITIIDEDEIIGASGKYYGDSHLAPLVLRTRYISPYPP
jgi:hypothetical protein